MKIDHINAQSLLANFDEICLLVNERNPDILCVTETWLTQYVLDQYIAIPNFSVYRHDKGSGGGVCIYVKDFFTVTPINVNIDPIEGVENLWLTVQCRKLPSIIRGCLYRHPHSNSHSYDYITNVFNHIRLRNKPFYVLGDFNCNFLSKNNKMEQIIKNTKLTQLIDKPTRNTSLSSTLLDIIVTNSHALALYHEVIDCPIADHDLISVTLDITKPKRQPEIKTFRRQKNYSPEILCNLLLAENQTLNKIYTTDNVDAQVQLFNEVFLQCLDLCAPVVTQELRRPFAPWITEELKNLIQQKNNALKELKKDRSSINLETIYKNLKRQVRGLIKISKSKYYNDKLNNNSGNYKAIWKTIRELVPNNKNNAKILSNIDDKESMKQIANTFNTFFAKVGKDTFEKSQQCLNDSSEMLHLAHTDSHAHPSSVILFRPTPIDWQTLTLTIAHMKNCDSCGSDCIPLKYLKDSLPVIVSYLTCIINTSIVTGVFPAAWKHSIVVPIMKSGNVNEPCNYRPISLLPVLSKVIEKIISSQLTQHLESNNLLSKAQHGFRSHLSTTSALLKLTSKLYTAMDNKKISLVTLCDLSKAFDSVSHPILLRKCYKLHIDPFWFHSYLSDRTQSVRLNKTMSDKSDISYGVPQGSVLGPILFTIYVNDLLSFLPNCEMIQYADDTQFIHTGNIDDINDLISKSEETIKLAKTYFHRNGLMLNTKKTQCMFVGTRGLLSKIPPDTHLLVDGNTITPSTSLKNLGVHFDSHLLFDTHITEISKKVFGTIMYVNRLRDYFNKNTRVTVIESLVMSIINYCISIWGTTNSTQIERVQKLQNFAAKVALGGAAKSDHATPFLKELGWLKINQKCKFEIAKITYNLINGIIPSWLFPLPTVSEMHAYSVNTRQMGQLHVPRCNTCLGNRSFLVGAPTLWNSLPNDVRCSTSINDFKRRLKNYLLCEQF